MRHDWNKSDLCAHCGANGREEYRCEADLICPGPKPAGNTGRHTSHVEMLQAAAYGAIPAPKTCGCVTLSCPHEPDPLNLATPGAGDAAAVLSQPERFGRASWDIPTSFDRRIGWKPGDCE